jgi:hypothetical protein
MIDNRKAAAETLRPFRIAATAGVGLPFFESPDSWHARHAVAGLRSYPVSSMHFGVKIM